MSTQTRNRDELRARFQMALQRLKDACPFEYGIANASPQLQVAYAKVLRHWLEKMTPPGRDLLPPSFLDALVAMDVVVEQEAGIGCYPFSARDTGIHVDHGAGVVAAMCAFDALAIPRLARSASRVTARCMVCRCHLAVAVEANGSLAHGMDEGIRVVWPPRDITKGACSYALCSGIRFLCKYCSIPAGTAGYQLAEAAALANNFFAFQARLLTHYPAQLGDSSLF